MKKRCSKCEAVKPIEEFPVSKAHGRERRRSECRDCYNALNRRRRQEDPERYRANWQRYAKNNPLKVAAKTAKDRAWRQANPQLSREKFAHYAPRYRTNHLDRLALVRAQKAGVYCESVSREEIIARDGPTCYLCGTPLNPEDRILTMDHVIPLSLDGPHTRNNLRVACRPCNTRKKNLPLQTYCERFGA